MSLVPWNGIDVKQVRHDLVQAEPQRMRLPQRAAIVHEVSSDDEENLRMDASSGLEVTVFPSTLTQTQQAGLKTRQETILGRADTGRPDTQPAKTRLDELCLMAEKAGLSVEEQLDSMHMPYNERSQKESTDQSRNRFMQETSYTNRDIGTNNREEVAYLVRESIQRVPTNNESMAISVMKDILQARNQAAELNVKIEMKNPDQVASLRMWQNSKKKPMSDLAEAILSRM